MDKWWITFCFKKNSSLNIPSRKRYTKENSRISLTGGLIEKKQKLSTTYPPGYPPPSSLKKPFKIKAFLGKTKKLSTKKCLTYYCFNIYKYIYIRLKSIIIPIKRSLGLRNYKNYNILIKLLFVHISSFIFY